MNAFSLSPTQEVGLFKLTLSKHKQHDLCKAQFFESCAFAIFEKGFMRKISIFCLYGLLTLNVFSQAFNSQSLKDKAAAGDQYSQLLLGLLHKNGQGVKQSFVMASEQLMEAAAQGNGDACYEIGKFHEKGYAFRQSYQTSADWYRRGVIFGEKRSAYALARLIVEGRVKPIGEESSDKMFKDSWVYFNEQIKKDNPEANYYLGMMCFKGWGVKRSPHEAIKYFKAGSDSFDGDSLYEYALFHLKGIIVEASAAKGIALLEKAVDNYSVDAMKMKMKLAQFGDNRLYLLPSREQQLLIEKNLADRGVSEYQYLYSMRLKKINMKEFRLSGLSYLEKAAQQQWTEAEFELGQIYLFGKYGIEQKTGKGKFYIESAASVGHAKAKRLLHELRKHSGK